MTPDQQQRARELIDNARWTITLARGRLEKMKDFPILREAMKEQEEELAAFLAETQEPTG